LLENKNIFLVLKSCLYDKEYSKQRNKTYLTFFGVKMHLYEFYKIMGCCCAMAERSGELPGNLLGLMGAQGAFRWDERLFGRRIRENDRRSAITTNNTSAKMSGAIPEASRF
jgi:hypothetical protein